MLHSNLSYAILFLPNARRSDPAAERNRTNDQSESDSSVHATSIEVFPGGPVWIRAAAGRPYFVNMYRVADVSCETKMPISWLSSARRFSNSPRISS